MNKKPYGYFIGIDPGEKGAICGIRAGSANPDFIAQIPYMSVKYDSDKMTKIVNPQAVRHLIEQNLPAFPAKPKIMVLLERNVINTMNGKIGARTAAVNIGLLIAGIQAIVDNQTTIVLDPKAWQREMLGKCKSGETKAKSLAVATGMAGSEGWFRRTPRCSTLSDGFSDAFLIAKYGQIHGSNRALTADFFQQ